MSTTPSVLWSYESGYSAIDDGSGFGTFEIDIPALAYDTSAFGLPILLVNVTSGTSGSGTFEPSEPPVQLSQPALSLWIDSTYSLTYASNDTLTNLVIPTSRLGLTLGEDTGHPDVAFLYNFTAVYPRVTGHVAFTQGGALTLRVRLNWAGVTLSSTGSGITTVVASTFPGSDAGVITAAVINPGVDPGFDVLAFAGYPSSYSTTTYAPVVSHTVVGQLISFQTLWAGVPASPGAFQTPSFPELTGDIELIDLNAGTNAATSNAYIGYNPSASLFSGGTQISNLVFSVPGGIQFGTSYRGVGFYFIQGDPLQNPGNMIVPISLTSGPRGLGKGPQFMKVPASLSSGQLRRRGRSYVQVIGRYPHAAPVYYPEKYAARRHDHQLTEPAHSV